MNLISSREAAESIGCNKHTINRWAKRLGIGQVVGVSRVFTGADLDRLREVVRDQPGNPNFGRVPE